MEKKAEDLDSWEQFEEKIKELQENSAAQGGNNQHGCISTFLYRGQGDASWGLRTTLERKSKKDWSVYEYYELISNVKSRVETFTKLRWKDMELSSLKEWATRFEDTEDYKSLLLQCDPLPGYEFMTFLRHHGFPSPLLDWSRSPYVAALFAFSNPCSDRVAIYAFQEYAGQGKEMSSDSTIVLSFGPNIIRGNKRHFLQQSEYTIAAEYKDNKWWFSNHENLLTKLNDLTKPHDRFFKFTLPTTERIKVLKKLDTFNLNSFSLFNTIETLMESIAIREFDFREDGI